MSQAMFQRQIKQHLVSNAKMAIIFSQISDLQFQLKIVTKNLKKIPIILFSVKIYKITIREVKETYDRPPCWHDGSKIIKNLGINIGRLFGPDILKLEESIFQSLIVTLLKLQLLRIFLYPDFNPILADHDHRIKILLRTKIYTSQYILYSVNNRQPIMLHLLLPRHKRYRTVDCMLHVLVIDHPFHLLLRSTFLACLLFYCFPTILYFFLYDAYFRYGVPEFLHLLAHFLLLSESVENIIRILITPNKYHPNKYKQQDYSQVSSTCMLADGNKKNSKIKNQNKVQASQVRSLLHTPELLLKKLLSLGILQFLKILGETNPQIEHIPHLLLTAVHSIHMIIIHTRQRQHQNLHTIYIIVLNGIGKCILIIDIFLIYIYMVFDEQFCYFGVPADTGPYQWSFPSIVDTENRQPFLYEDCPYFFCVALLNRCEYLTSEFVGLITEDLFGYDVLQGQLHFFQLVYNQLDICSEFLMEYFFTLSLHLHQLLISHRLFRCHFLLFFIRHSILTQSFYIFQTIPDASRHFTPLFLRKLVREVSIIFTVFIEELFGILAVLLHFGIGRDIVVEAQEILAHFLLVQLFLGFFVQLLIDYGVLEGFHPESAYGWAIYIYIFMKPSQVQSNVPSKSILNPVYFKSQVAPYSNQQSHSAYPSQHKSAPTSSSSQHETTSYNLVYSSLGGDHSCTSTHHDLCSGLFSISTNLSISILWVGPFWLGGLSFFISLSSIIFSIGLPPTIFSTRVIKARNLFPVEEVKNSKAQIPIIISTSSDKNTITIVNTIPHLHAIQITVITLVRSSALKKFNTPSYILQYISIILYSNCKFSSGGRSFICGPQRGRMFCILLMIAFLPKINIKHKRIALILGNSTRRVRINPTPIVYSGIFHVRIVQALLDNLTIGSNRFANEQVILLSYRYFILFFQSKFGICSDSSFNVFLLFSLGLLRYSSIPTSPF